LVQVDRPSPISRVIGLIAIDSGSIIAQSLDQYQKIALSIKYTREILILGVYIERGKFRAAKE